MNRPNWPLVIPIVLCALLWAALLPVLLRLAS